MDRILNRTIKIKKRTLSPYKRFHGPGEPAYDYPACVLRKEKAPVIRREDGRSEHREEQSASANTRCTDRERSEHREEQSASANMRCTDREDVVEHEFMNVETTTDSEHVS
jgi:hypothetical protein